MQRSLIDIPGLWRPIVFVLVPLLLEQAVVLFLYASDQFLLGHYFETHHLAAYGTVSYLVLLFYGIASLVLIGSAVMVARFSGAKDLVQINRVLNQSLFLAVLIGTGLLLYWSYQSEPTFRWLGLKGEALRSAVEYMQTLRWIFPVYMIYIIGVANFHGSGNMIVGLTIMCVMTVTHIAVAWGCVTGLGIFPSLGWRGMAFGVACGYAVGGVSILFALVRGVMGRRLIFRDMIPRWSVLRGIMKVGLPGGCTVLVAVFSELWFLSQVNRFGELSAAAHEVCFRVQSMAFNPAHAMYLASMTLIGQYLGAGMIARLKKTAWTVYVLGLVYLVPLAVMFFLFSAEIPGVLLKSSQEELVGQASSLMKISAFILPAFAGSMVLNGALQGTGDTRTTFLISLIGFFAVRVPIVCLLANVTSQIPLLGVTIPGLGLGITAAWIALLADYWTRSLLCLARFLNGGWAKNRI